MKIARDIFKCVAVVNLVVYLLYAAVEIIFHPSREIEHRLNSIVAASWLVLLAVSVIFLFLDRRAAIKGFLVLWFGFLIAALFPEL